MNAAKKKTSSTNGMQRAVITSRLLPHRVNYVPQNIEKLTEVNFLLNVAIISQNLINHHKMLIGRQES